MLDGVGELAFVWTVLNVSLGIVSGEMEMQLH